MVWDLLLTSYVTPVLLLALFQGIVSDPSVILTPPILPRPAYLNSMIDPTFGTTFIRIGNDTLKPTTPLTGIWGSDSRHDYSKVEPWNSDQTLYAIENPPYGGGIPSAIILDASTFQPKYAKCDGLFDFRWHTSQDHPFEMINVTKTGTTLEWVDVRTCVRTQSWALPITANYGIGSGEGNTSFDGRYVLIGNDTQVVVVDMVQSRIGPIYTLPPCNFDLPAPCTIGNRSISPLGDYADIKYSSTTFDTQDVHRIFSVDLASLILTPVTMDVNSKRCGQFVGRNDGWIFPLKHADMTLNPFDSNEEVIVGGQSACHDDSMGHVVMVRLKDGLVTSLTDPNNETAEYHLSARNLKRLGWVYVTFANDPKYIGKRFFDEVVAIKLDGSQTVERLIFTRSDYINGGYRAEAHAVPSPDGTKIAFASNWMLSCGSSCGAENEYKDYVVDTGLGTVSPPPVEPENQGGGGCGANSVGCIEGILLLSALWIYRKRTPTNDG